MPIYLECLFFINHPKGNWARIFFSFGGFIYNSEKKNEKKNLVINIVLFISFYLPPKKGHLLKITYTFDD